MALTILATLMAPDTPRDAIERAVAATRTETEAGPPRAGLPPGE